MYRIMVVDDEPNILKTIARRLSRNAEWEVETYTDPLEALRRAQTTNFELFISDYRMPQMSGVELLKQVKLLQPESMRIILSGHSDMEAVLSAINEAEIYRFIQKPWDNNELEHTISQALAFHQILVENRHLADTVRRQLERLDKQEKILAQLEAEAPGITQVERLADGSINLKLDEEG